MKMPFLKISLFIIFIVFITNVFGQVTDSIGLDNNPILNGQESKMLHDVIDSSRAKTDLTGKKIAFITGSTGSVIVSKSNYFRAYVKPGIETGNTMDFHLLALTKDEKLKSGGYDFIALSWVKIFTDRQRRKIIHRLRPGIK